MIFHASFHGAPSLSCLAHSWLLFLQHFAWPLASIMTSYLVAHPEQACDLVLGFFILHFLVFPIHLVSSAYSFALAGVC
jgi:hypothetical protein